MHYSTLFEQALAHFPFSKTLEETSITQGDLEASDPRYGLEYSAEYTFEAGHLLDEPLMAGGWIEIRQDPDDAQPSITAFFGVARNGDWEAGRILPETTAIQGHYDLESQSWELWIDQY